MSLTKVSYSMINGIPINVKDYGAVGDGSTDDTSAIQAAFTAAVANGGGTVYFPDTASFYKVTSTVNIAATANSVTILGDGIFRSEIKMVTASADTLFTCAGSLYVTNISITGMPSSGNVYRAGDIGFESAGPISMLNVSLYGWDNGIKWTGGYYYKFVGCDMRLMNIALNTFDANNVMIDKCKVSELNKLIVLSSGAGPTVINKCSLESWTQAIASVASGASPQIIVSECYIENYPSDPVAAGLYGSYYNNGWVVINGGHTVLRDNFISCKGIRRIFDSGGACDTFRTTGNYIEYQVSNSTTDYLYIIGTVDTVIISDYANGGLPPGTGAYTTVAYDSISPNEAGSCSVVNPISLKYVALPVWADMTLANSWANQDTTNYPAASYQKINNRVFLRGYITGASATSATFATLPVGNRPTTKTYRAMTGSRVATTADCVNIRVSSTGDLSLSNSPYTLTSISLDGMSFDVD
jgi:hypothetical protein